MTMASFAEFSSRAASLPTWPMEIFTDLDCDADITRLENERLDILDAQEAAKEAGTARARKAGQGVNPRLAEIEAELKPLYERRAQSVAILKLREMPFGDWGRFVEQHPATKESAIDQVVGWGIVSVVAVSESLGDFIVGWDEEVIPSGAWTDDHTAKIPSGQIQTLIREIVHHQQKLWEIPPKSQSGSGATEDSATA
jgi:hypothetical protein